MFTINTKVLTTTALLIATAILSACSGGGSSSSTPVAADYPTKLSATVSDGQVSLSWVAVAGATTYTVYYATTNLTVSNSATALQALTGIATTTVSQTSATISDLTNSTTYYFRVTALKAESEGSPSDQVVAVPTLPAPTDLQASTGIAQVNLNWREVAGATYKVYYSTTNLAESTSVASLHTLAGVASKTVSTTNAVIVNLASDLYSFKVTALEAGAESAPSNNATAQPSWPASTTIWLADAGYRLVYLDWTPVDSVSNYTVHYATESFQGKSLSDFSSLQNHRATKISASNYTVEGLVNDTTYYFIVTNVLDGVESSLYSKEVSATPALEAPSNIISLQPDLRQMSVSFVKGNANASYNIYYATESFADISDLANYHSLSGAGRVEISSSINTFINHPITELLNDTKYYVVVTAVLDGNESAPSTEQTAIPRLSKITGHMEDVNAVAFSLDGERIVSGSNDNTVRILSSTSGIAISTLTHTQSVKVLALSSDGGSIVSGGNAYVIRLWNATSGTEIASLTGHANWTNSIAFNSSGTQVVSGGWQKTYIWTINASASTLAHTLSGHTGETYAAFHPTHTQLITGDAAGNIRLWNSTSGEQIGSTVTSTSTINAIAFSPNGERFAVGNDDNNILIYSSTSNQLVHTLSGHVDDVWAIAFTPDGSKLVSSSWDIRIWDVAVGGTALATLTGHTREIKSVAVSPDGKRIVSGSLDKTVRVWYPEVLQAKNPTGGN